MDSVIFHVIIGALILVGTDACADPLELNKCYRFESVNFEGEFIQHSKWELWKKPGVGMANWEHSTWKVVPAVNGDSKHISLEALNFPGYQINHAGFKGFLKKCSENCKENASWAVKNGFMKSTYCEGTVSFESFNYPGYHLRHSSHRLIISPYQRTDIYEKDASWVYREVSCKKNFQCAAP